MTWQPIETEFPPTDGKRVLLWDGVGVFIGRYMLLGRWEDDHGDRVEPTHWMPLPEPPEE